MVAKTWQSSSTRNTKFTPFLTEFMKIFRGIFMIWRFSSIIIILTYLKRCVSLNWGFLMLICTIKRTIDTALDLLTKPCSNIQSKDLLICESIVSEIEHNFFWYNIYTSEKFCTTYVFWLYLSCLVYLSCIILSFLKKKSLK